jgi:hypothetical protein
MGTGRGAGRDGGAAGAAVLQQHVDLHGGVAAAVEDLAGMYVENGGHCYGLVSNYIG